jgi:periplasmic protein TonB
MKKAAIYQTLTNEISHHPFLGLLTVLTLLIHLWIVVKLMQPTEDADKIPEQLKIMEVALVTEQKPKTEAAPPAPPKQEPPRKVPSKNKIIEPPVKKKVREIHKQGEIPVTKTVNREVPPTAPMPALISPNKPAPASSSPATTSKSVIKPVTDAGEGKSKGANSGIVELGCPKPRYPARAMSRHIEGWVKIEMTVNTDGSVSNARVAASEPSGIFDDAALSAISNCRFKPKMVNGKAVAQRGVKKSTFKLTN